MAFFVDGHVYNEIRCACKDSPNGDCGRTAGWYTVNTAGYRPWNRYWPYHTYVPPSMHVCTGTCMGICACTNGIVRQ